MAIRNAAVNGNLVFRLTDLLDAVGATARTDLPPERLPALAALAEEIGGVNTTRVVIRSPLVHGSSNAFGSVQIPNLAAIRAVAAALFPPPGTAPIPWPTPTPTKASKASPSP